MHNVRITGTLCTVRQRFRVLSSGAERLSEGTYRRRFGKAKALLQAERQVASSRTLGSIKQDSGHFLLDLPFFFGVEPDIGLIRLNP